MPTTSVSIQITEDGNRGETFKSAKDARPGHVFEGSDGSHVWVPLCEEAANMFVCLLGGRKLKEGRSYFSETLEESGVALREMSRPTTYEIHNHGERRHV